MSSEFSIESSQGGDREQLRERLGSLIGRWEVVVELAKTHQISLPNELREAGLRKVRAQLGSVENAKEQRFVKYQKTLASLEKVLKKFENELKSKKIFPKPLQAQVAHPPVQAESVGGHRQPKMEDREVKAEEEIDVERMEELEEFGQELGHRCYTNARMFKQVWKEMNINEKLGKLYSVSDVIHSLCYEKAQSEEEVRIVMNGVSGGLTATFINDEELFDVIYRSPFSKEALREYADLWLAFQLLFDVLDWNVEELSETHKRLIKKITEINREIKLMKASRKITKQEAEAKSILGEHDRVDLQDQVETPIAQVSEPKNRPGGKYLQERKRQVSEKEEVTLKEYTAHEVVSIVKEALKSGIELKGISLFVGDLNIETTIQAGELTFELELKAKKVVKVRVATAKGLFVNNPRGKGIAIADDSSFQINLAKKADFIAKAFGQTITSGMLREYVVQYIPKMNQFIVQYLRGQGISADYVKIEGQKLKAIRVSSV